MHTNKRALVTGGSRGIGKATSLMLAKNGYEVIVNYKSNTESANQTLNELKEFNPKCKLLQFDIGNLDETQTIIENEIKNNGNIDILIFNAGIKKDVLFPVMKKEDWDTVIDVNFKSFYYVVKPVIVGMFQQKFGKIVVISSTAGLSGMAGQVNYSSSKFGIIGAAKSLAVEVARRNINVNVIAPGFVDTEMIAELKSQYQEIKKTIPSRRIGTPEDIANVVEFLVSEKSDYIVGQVIAVNGGVT